MSCCGQCGGESHSQTEKQVDDSNEDQTTTAQSQTAEKTEDE